VDKEAGPDPKKTLTDSDPILMGGGDYREYWRLLSLGGPMSLDSPCSMPPTSSIELP
jgi:hypothetical protein